MPIELKPVAEALTEICAALQPVDTQNVSFKEAANRILAEHIAADYDHPPAAVSAMDGYAVQTGGTPLVAGSQFTVVGEAAAGHLFTKSITGKQTVRIFTGGHVPEGADAVILQEDVSLHENIVTLNEAAKPGQFIRPAGLDFQAGQIVLKSGTALGARQMALAALCGHAETLIVRRKPLVAILSSGDELVPPGTPPAPGQLVNSNSIFLAHAVQLAGGEAVNLGIVPDQPGALTQCLNTGQNIQKQPFDLILTTGGASVGRHDHIVSDLTEADPSALSFWKIAMRPGKPLIFGQWNRIPLLGLPGNPVSAGVCMTVFGLPALRTLLGQQADADIRPIRLSAPVPENDRRQDYLRGVFEGTGDARTIRPLGRQDSSMLKAFSDAQGLIIRPPNAPALEAGDMVSVLVLPDGL